MSVSNNEPNSDVIAGRNPVSEAIRSNRPIDKIMVARGEKSGAVVGILAKAREKKIPVKEVDRAKLDYLSGGAVHQGIIAFAAAKEYCSVDDIFACAENRGEAPFIIVLDELEDPHRGMRGCPRRDRAEKTQRGSELYGQQGKRGRG